MRLGLGLKLAEIPVRDSMVSHLSTEEGDRTGHAGLWLGWEKQVLPCGSE
jgi:hypothetical protein